MQDELEEEVVVVVGVDVGELLVGLDGSGVGTLLGPIVITGHAGNGGGTGGG